MELNTAEQFLLLAINTQSGRLFIRNELVHCFTGAMLHTLALKRRIVLDKSTITTCEGVASGCKTIDIFFDDIAHYSKSRRLSFWLARYSYRGNRCLRLLLSEMEQKRLIRIERHRVLGIFPANRYFIVDVMGRHNLIKDIKTQLFVGKELSSSSFAIMSLVHLCRLHSALATGYEVKQLRRKLKATIGAYSVTKAPDGELATLQLAINRAVAVAVNNRLNF